MSAIVPFETLPQLFDRITRLYAGQQRTALRYMDRKTKQWTEISWESLHAMVESMAGYLHKSGIRKGDRVAILAENRPEWAVVDLATHFIGAVNVSLYTSLPASQVGYILKDSGSSLFFVSTAIQLRKAEEIFDSCPNLKEIVTMSEMRADRPEHVRAWDAVMADGQAYWEAHRAELSTLHEAVTAEDLCALIYTSGTTGNPKGVMLTHRNLCSNAISALNHVPFGPDDHHLSFLPLCHSFERTAGYTAIMAAGAKITYAESIDTVSRNLGEVKPTVMISVPRLFEKMYNLIAKSVEEGSPLKKKIFNWSVNAGKKAALARNTTGSVGPILRLQQAIGHKLVFARLHEKLGGNLRFAVSGGAALPKAIGEFFMAAGVTIVEGYGLTETSPVLTANPYRAPRYGTVGHVLPGVTVGIQHTGTKAIIGQLTGEQYPSAVTTEEGEIIAKGPNIMKGYWNNPEATAEAIDAQGWYHTGDIGKFVDGYLVITDRIKHMIVSAGGKNIYPGPIEEQFKTNALIDQVMVVGEGREYLTALVVPMFDALKVYAREQSIVYTTDAELLANESIKKLYAETFKTYSKTAAAPEKIRDFRFVAEAFTVDNEMMTPTMKLKRKVIEAKYKNTIEQMYGVFA
ncbi:MAG: long-chain fatty acid--CoA ligase [Rhodothermales bacterium]|nr:long-chain fatty acid--CoA ligase [Rhodothermales bacterium]